MMRNYDARDTKTTVDELDPCLAAEVRMKNNALFNRKNRLTCIFIAIAIAIFIVAALFLIGFLVFSSTDNQNNDSVAVRQGKFVNVPSNPDFSQHNDDAYDELPPSKARGEVIANNGILEPPKHDDSVIPMGTTADTETVIPIEPSTERPIVTVTTTTPPPPSEPSTLRFVPVTPRMKPLTSTLRPTASTRPTEIVTYATKSDDLPEILPSFTDVDDHKFDFIETDDIFEDCNQYRKAGHKQSGVYEFDVKGLKFTALCLMEADHSWMALQRRTNGALSFNRTFEEYANGFGHSTGEHWLGLEKVHTYIKQGHKLQLRIELRGDFCSRCSKLNETGFWFGDWDFEIESRKNKYQLSISKILKGNLTDASRDHFHFMNNGRYFTTYDQDNDNKDGINCANVKQYGPWWHHDCTLVALNGKYGSTSKLARDMSWYYDLPQTGRNNARITYYLKPQLSIMKFRIK